MMALYVASHYKNQPNDLQLLSDAPAHHLFVLLPPIKDDESHLPEPLVVLQVALEGGISREVIMDGLGRGISGDMIPWLVTQQFQESRFGQLSGARVVRIACHPDYANVRWLQLEFLGRIMINFHRWVTVREHCRLLIRFIVGNTLTLTNLLYPKWNIRIHLLSILYVPLFSIPVFSLSTPQLVNRPPHRNTFSSSSECHATSPSTVSRA